MKKFCPGGQETFQSLDTPFDRAGFAQIRKRDGTIVFFDASKIAATILKAGRATGEFGEETAQGLTDRVLSSAQKSLKGDIPAVEQIQDLVEDFLLTSPFKKTAKPNRILD